MGICPGSVRPKTKLRCQSTSTSHKPTLVLNLISAMSLITTITFAALFFSLSPSKSTTATTRPLHKEDSKNNTKREKRSFVNRIHEHVKLGPKFSETVKGKLSLGVKVIQEGGRRNIFRNVFGMQEEKLLKASQCYLYTTTGPIAGILFILTVKVAFCNERHICFSSADGESVKAPYKISFNLKPTLHSNDLVSVLINLFEFLLA